MTARLTQQEADEALRLLAAGTPPRQVEKMLGLTYGILSRTFVIGEDPRPIRDRGLWVYPNAQTVARENPIPPLSSNDIDPKESAA